MIDVIIPVYNGHKYLDIALKSLAEQTIKDKLCVYIIDDASTYGYSEFVKKYKGKLIIKEITCKKKRNAAAARQKGIEVSQNEYITFVDCDDSLPKDALEKLYIQISNNTNLQFVSGYTNVNGKKIYYIGSMCGRIFRRSFLKKYNIKCKYLYTCEDSLFMQTVYYLCSQNEYLVIDDIVYNYNKGLNKNSSTMINNDYEKRIMAIFQAYKIAIKHAKKYHKYENIYKLSADIFYQAWIDMNAWKDKMSAEEYTKILNKLYNFYKKYQKEIEYNISKIDNPKFKNFYITLGS